MVHIFANEPVTFLDPIHGAIELDRRNEIDHMLLKLIDSLEFQRLRRIRQLGFSNLTYCGAESTRFVHSIGTMHVAKLALQQLTRKGHVIDEFTQASILAAALLHDIGHGPFSHSSETAFGFHHEAYTILCISSVESTVQNILTTFDAKLTATVADLIGIVDSDDWKSQMISSQFDCDRADYLMRDSHQTGTKYGMFQLERILQNLELHTIGEKLKLCVNRKGLNAIEHYLFSRYSMYLQVYHHKTTMAADTVFSSIIRRAADLVHSGNPPPYACQEFLSWLQLSSKPLVLRDFLAVDDSVVNFHLQLWCHKAEDVILRDLSNRLLNRRLFKARRLSEVSDKCLLSLQEHWGEKDANYYCIKRGCREFPYSDNKGSVLIATHGGVQELSMVSNLARSLLKSGEQLDNKWLFTTDEALQRCSQR